MNDKGIKIDHDFYLNNPDQIRGSLPAQKEFDTSALAIAELKAANMTPAGLDIPLMTHDFDQMGCNGLATCPVHPAQKGEDA